jgi:hypothetical protein
MPGPRRRLAAFITSGVTLALTAGFGSPFSVEHLSARHNALLAELLQGLWFPRWSVHRDSSVPHSMFLWIAPMVADVVLAALTGLIAAVIVANRTRLPALLAGWCTAMVLAAAVGVARVFVIAAISHPGPAVYAQAGTALTTGLWFGLVTGWLSGAIVACTVRKNGDDGSRTGLIEEREVSGVRIWSPSQPDWQNTQDLPVPDLRQPLAPVTTAQPTITQPATAQPTTAQPTTAPPTTAQPSTAAPWPPSTPPEA